MCARSRTIRTITIAITMLPVVVSLGCVGEGPREATPSPPLTGAPPPTEQIETSVPTPTATLPATPTASTFPVESVTPIPLATISVIEGGARSAELVLIGTPVRAVEVEERPQGDRSGATYRDWVVEVEQYLKNPRSESRVVVRTRKDFIHPGGTRISAKEVGLSENQRVLLFLGRRAGFSLEPGQFTILNPMIGVFPIKDGQVFYPLWVVPAKEPLESAIARITRTKSN